MKRTALIGVHEVKDMEDFQNQLTAAGGNLVVIDFHATWCGPCKRMAPHLKEMTKTKENVVFLKVDVDDCEDTAAQYKITTMPTFLFVKSNTKVADLPRAIVEELKELVNSHK